MNQEMYHEWAKHYDYENIELRVLKQHNIDFTNKIVLEVGCGTGRFTNRIIPSAREIVAIDPCESAIELCKKHTTDNNVTYIVGTLEDLNIPSNMFDYVVFSWSMYLIENKVLNLQIAHSALKQDGALIVLQASSGEFEEEGNKLYETYSPIREYSSTNSVLEEALHNTFGNVDRDEIKTHFIFSSIDEVVDYALMFVEDSEGKYPSEDVISLFKNTITKYKQDDGTFKLTDIVDLFISWKKMF